jgi:hypothetical protein
MMTQQIEPQMYVPAQTQSCQVLGGWVTKEQWQHHMQCHLRMATQAQ